MTEEKNWENILLRYKFAKTMLEKELEIIIGDYEHRTSSHPVEHIKSRLKSKESILKKLEKKKVKTTPENIKKYVHDVVGIRIVCSFLSDVYDMVNIIKSSKNLKVLEENDYIKNPKSSGYSSYHLNILIPLYLEENIEYIEGEIQIRTLAMDFWASLEHKLQCKLPENIPVYLRRELYSCSEEVKSLDTKMQHLYDIVKKYTDN